MERTTLPSAAKPPRFKNSVKHSCSGSLSSLNRSASVLTVNTFGVLQKLTRLRRNCFGNVHDFTEATLRARLIVSCLRQHPVAGTNANSGTCAKNNELLLHSTFDQNFPRYFSHRIAFAHFVASQRITTPHCATPPHWTCGHTYRTEKLGNSLNRNTQLQLTV